MSLAQCKVNKRYNSRHRAEHLKACKQRHIRNKEEDNASCRRRNHEITEGARRWRKIVGKYYWTQKYGGFG